MQSPPIGCRELDLLTHEILHVHEEHARATAESIRRRLGARLLELEERFERTLAEEVPDEALREAWREHLHGRAPAPSEPPALPIIVFRGRSEAGSDVVVRGADDGELRVEVDGALLDRVVELDLRSDPGGWIFRGREPTDFRETLAAGSAAVEALRAWMGSRRGAPPWEHLRELAADGLVDRHFSLTPRGRRVLGQQAA